MALPQIDQVEELATKYTKPQLQRMAQMGQIDPTMAVMAGMMMTFTNDDVRFSNRCVERQTFLWVGSLSLSLSLSH